MSLEGRIQDGAVVFDQPVPLAEGTRVRVEPVSVPPDRNGDRESLVGTPSFWMKRSVEELAAEQKPQPLNNLNELGGEWPEEDSVDEFLALVRKVRS
jgi:hypothetical protein